MRELRLVGFQVWSDLLTPDQREVWQTCQGQCSSQWPRGMRAGVDSLAEKTPPHIWEDMVELMAEWLVRYTK